MSKIPAKLKKQILAKSVKKVCLNCSNEFEVDRNQSKERRESQRFCRHSCIAEARHKTRAPNICIICNEPFFPKRKNGWWYGPVQALKIKTCSYSCKIAYMSLYRLSNPIRYWLGKRGREHGAWRGIDGSIKDTIRNQIQYSKWRMSVFKRDGFACRECGLINQPIVAHHIIPFSRILHQFSITTVEDAIDCELLWDINNGITLCDQCHLKTDSYGGKSMKLIYDTHTPKIA